MLGSGDRRRVSPMIPLSDGLKARNFPIVNVALIVAIAHMDGGQVQARDYDAVVGAPA
jgi:hypothetical protein